MGSIRQTTRPAPQRLRPGRAEPNAARWKNESPVSTCSPRATSQSYSSRCCCAVGCRVPDVGATAGWTQPGEPQLSAEPVGERLELVELAGVLPGDDDGDLEPGEARLGEVAHRGQRGRIGPRAAYRVVDLGRRTVQGDLHVDVVAGRELPGHPRGDLDTVGG